MLDDGAGTPFFSCANERDGSAVAASIRARAALGGRFGMGLNAEGTTLSTDWRTVDGFPPPTPHHLYVEHTPVEAESSALAPTFSFSQAISWWLPSSPSMSMTSSISE